MCSGRALLNKLNMSVAVLIPMSQRVVAVNKKLLTILGGPLLEIKAEKHGKKKTTKQFSYLCVCI